jgi:hypothetical protein
VHKPTVRVAAHEHGVNLPRASVRQHAT